MGMKETEGSLRAYFLIAGVLAILMGISDLSKAQQFAAFDLPMDWTLALYVPLLSRIAIGVGFLVAGIRLKTALVAGVDWIKRMLVASGGLLLLNGALVVSVLGPELGRTMLITTAVGVAVTIYLHRSVARLSAEAKVREGIPPAPPAARVV